jgi:RNA polymerase sigma-70 factor, ECF subfamily
MTEYELIEGLLKHDRTAILALLNNYQKKVIKTAFYFTHNMEDAEELSQDIFIEVLNRVQYFRKTSALSTWIYRITVNRSLNLVKKNKHRKLISSLEDLFNKKQNSADPVPYEPASTTFPYEDNERRELLYKSIHSLPENQKITFILNKYEGLSYKEIAGIMNLSISSIESLLHRAKINLQKKLAFHFSEYSKKNKNGMFLCQ